MTQNNTPSHVDVYDGHYLLDDGGVASDFSLDSEQWEFENREDPIDPSDMQELQNSTLARVVGFYWAMRTVTRRYRVAAGKFGPRRRFTRERAKKRFKGTGGGRRFGKLRKGFYVVDTWISLDELSDESLEV